MCSIWCFNTCFLLHILILLDSKCAYFNKSSLSIICHSSITKIKCSLSNLPVAKILSNLEDPEFSIFTDFITFFSYALSSASLSKLYFNIDSKLIMVFLWLFFYIFDWIAWLDNFSFTLISSTHLKCSNLCAWINASFVRSSSSLLS